MHGAAVRNGWRHRLWQTFVFHDQQAGFSAWRYWKGQVAVAASRAARSAPDACARRWMMLRAGETITDAGKREILKKKIQHVHKIFHRALANVIIMYNNNYVHSKPILHICASLWGLWTLNTRTRWIFSASAAEVFRCFEPDLYSAHTDWHITHSRAKRHSTWNLLV